ncbi:YceI family protein [Novosphingobium sp. FKTRR1]|uniref:YceI family protein n=1 Tax=Novosphingobium sp. FKTRR1 TaxID=2879118 RepID=UPI001CF0790A|nr:YceI family protein [Novosphingobium sp. FKTRR1]
MNRAGLNNRYSPAAIVLHWSIAALLAFQLSLGWRLEDLPKGAGQFAAFQLHKSVGITILLLTLIRVAIRLFVRQPVPLPAPPPLKALVSAVHLGLYAVMLGGPLTGWALVSTAKIRLHTMLFGTVPWPDLPVPAAWHEPAETIHGLLGWLLVGLFVLHVAGALRHHLLRDDTIGRMIPLRSHRALSVAVVVALGGVLLAMSAAKLITFGAASASPSATPSAAPSDEVPEATTVAADDAVASSAPSADASAGADATKVADWAVAKGGRLGFAIVYTGSPIEGSFAKWDAAIRFSPDDLAGSSIKVTVDLASVGSGDSQRDDMLRSDSFFAVGAHPVATFVSSSIREAGKGRYRAPGTLSLNGRKQPVTLDFTLDIAGDTARAKGSASLRRTAFGVGTAEWAATDELKDDVRIAFALTARRKP